MADTARQAVVARLAGFPDRLGPVARDVAEADAADGPPTGEWTALQNVAHLVAVERGVWHARLDGLAANPGVDPVWTWTEPGPADDAMGASLEGALAVFGRERMATLARLEALDEPGWARAGLHATYGRLDIAGLLRVAADHDDEHLAGMTKGRSLPGG
jgi:hypothetical protein